MQTRMSLETGMQLDYVSVTRMYDAEALLLPLAAYKKFQRKLKRETK